MINMLSTMEILTKCKNVFRLKKLNYMRNLSSSALDTNNKNVVVDRHGDITMISINRPSKRNCLDMETFTQLISELRTFDEDSNAKVAILHGEGGNFSSGFDMEEITEKGYDTILKTINNFDGRPLCKKPLIGAISGYTVAEGFELALACDLRVVEDTASMGVLGRRFGAPMLMGGAKRLSDLVGAARALDLVMTGRVITAITANEWGLAARLVATGTALGQALNLAVSIAKFPTNGVQYDKLNIYKSLLKENKGWIEQNEQDLKSLKAAAIKDLETNAIKFKEGIGKHGKFKNISIKEIKSWEREDDVHQGKV